MTDKHSSASTISSKDAAIGQSVDTSESQTATSNSSLEQTISPEFPPLTMEDVETLRSCNTSDERIREIAARREAKCEQKKASKKDLTSILAERREWLLEQSAGKPLFSGKTAGSLLIRSGHHDPVRGFNAFGDKLGKNGHNLPSVMIDGARRYDIAYIGRSAEEKESRQQYFDRRPLDVLRELLANINDVEEPTPFPGKALS